MIYFQSVKPPSLEACPWILSGVGRRKESSELNLPRADTDVSKWLICVKKRRTRRGEGETHSSTDVVGA